MKIILVLKDKSKQIVLTPESEEEKSIFDLFAPTNVKKEIEIFQGGYEIEKCVGGWLHEYPIEDSIILYIKD